MDLLSCSGSPTDLLWCSGSPTDLLWCSGSSTDLLSCSGSATDLLWCSGSATCYGAVVALSATDDITFIRCEEAQINQVERVLPSMLSEEGLFINKSKTEKYHISKCSDTKWKSSKYLGSLIGTEEDIKRRKGLTHVYYHALESILKNKLVSEPVRIRIFKAYIDSIFLYNSELSTLTNTLERSIDSFHRRLLRKVIHVTWPRLITNEELEKRTKVMEPNNM